MKGYWPKFMRKRHEPEFRSDHILNELHEKSNSILHLISIAQREAQASRKKSGLIDLKDVDITEYDRKMFSEYKEAVNALKVRYQIKSEGELFSNSFVDIPGTLKNYKDPMGDDGCPAALVQKKVFEIFEKFRTKILDRFASHQWRTEMEINNDNIFTYKISAISPDMIKVAKAYYALAEEDGECYSFPWLTWEALDIIFCEESANDPHNETSCTFEKEILDLISTNTDYASSFVALEEEFPDFPWFRHFAVMVNSFMVSNGLLIELLSDAVYCYMDILEDEDRSVKIPKTATGAFFNFLITIISPNFDHDGSYDKKECEKLFKAAQSTLISYAFFPENQHFCGIKLHEQVMIYPPFVISIPACWTKEYERKYKILQRLSGCHQVVTEKRKSLTHYTHYTIMCRGTLECCQKLETMLTPFIKPIDSKSIKETKIWKGKAMQNLLMNVFGFRIKKQPQRKPPVRRTFLNRLAPLTIYNTLL